MTRLFIDVHILQTVPPSNVNRDDTGSPKTAVYGGVRRARVSSQAWKRATRTEFRSLVDPASLGVRTKRVVELIAERIGEIDHDSEELREPDNRVAAAVQVLKGAGIVLEKPKKKKDEVIDPVEQSKYLLFLSANQIDRLAHLAIAAAKGATLDKSAAKAAANGADSIDVALFGRMVADSTDLNVDAAAQVAHAISVHGVNNEFDYYTAVDDRSPEDNAGAGMIGVVEFNSSTLYRYATVDLGMLEKNLGSAEATVLAVEAFAKAFVRSMPSGKQNTFAHRTLPDAVVFSLREDQPVNLVTAFEEPVNAVGAARSVAAAKALVTRYSAIESSFGDGATRNFVVATGEGADTLSAIAEPVSFAEAVEGVVDTVRAALGVSS
ncbi:type I-E CRISPR-associated protein Cas7/Cse4/CasC [Nocardia farcinica]|uniref:CRISPR-associated protein Cas7/Cse4/CasC, subtype I-E/ECOLI n=3 Tax=Nocardia TaxID=1817 RepID=A0A449H2J4_NOCFR|nr:type I-E CRISPR-associated protein Cas7/Cse4/CasC [Nocardia farcinica]MBF6295388.1 type I-E CRISPR-associated protein Cas7/Cse4/CasC [Nocardia farcinica]MBF6376261.1 type I-E CRISPR-associated protein Cas7/Cse4/CasC [Nocardia farcinica]MBF6381960.1 type I-E CRISPR-associated protein Cas7/Cse4/CasC [Nocardia farcinica]MBF6421509.1 type I-E CRISPR-associated protein Cas7/Cse4/CasC [Nocardia farcinica]MBF6433166.1 type I-E CRISPR-associated protein Cas7/Cse4/CasC [Nocardia farcinica]